MPPCSAGSSSYVIGMLDLPSGPHGALAHDIYRSVVTRLRARIPRVTYRLQLNREFGFGDALAIVDYLDALGISDVYLSPCFKARPDSLHGYDVIDHTQFNPTIGTRADFDRLTDALRARGMGLLLDTVPNHMGIGSGGNPWWSDVLENGPGSLYADHFDIDWKPLKAELENKVLLPVLGDHYGRVLERGELSLHYDEGAFAVRYYEMKLPLNPRTYRAALEPTLPELVEALGEVHDTVLELQSILTGLDHLPSGPETRRVKVIERHREKEMLKRRLHTLVSGSPLLLGALERSLALLNGRPGEPRSFDGLHRLLEAQAYRLSYFRVAAEEINYRRFFDVNDLAALRMENPVVFAGSHRLLLELVGEGRVTGLRIDHPDGLWNPAAYLHSLQRGVFAEHCWRVFLRLREREADDVERADQEEFHRLLPSLLARWERDAEADPERARPLYVVVEKILGVGERLPDDWATHGTTGYEFGVLACGLLVDPAGERPLTALYQRLVDQRTSFPSLAHDKKQLVLRTALASELSVLGHALNRISERNRHYRDFTLGALTHALGEAIAWFPVYRTYVAEQDETVSLRDRQAIERAIRMARRGSPVTDPSVYGFVKAALLLELPGSPEEKARVREFVMKFQQLTGPVMAKGLEDTAFYVYNRLVALNEVGGDPDRFAVSLAEFHRANEERQRHFPHAMLATSTHDSKRSEDVRARIAVLSEVPERWAAAVEELRAATLPLRTELEGEWAPDANDEYLFYQTVVGSLPFGIGRHARLDDEALAAYADRVVAYMHKAIKEAKLHTSWINPDLDYEAAVERFVRGALQPGGRFLDVLVGPSDAQGGEAEVSAPIGRLAAYHGMWGSLSQLLIKLTAPGVPDVYQGNELWQLRLVDPDNRQPVDLNRRRELLAALDAAPDRQALAAELVAHAEDGRVKLHVTRTALALRRELPALFAAGDYRAVGAEGAFAEHVVAFARLHGHEEVVTVAPRWSARLATRHPGDALRPPTGALWGDTRLPLPPGRYRERCTGRWLIVDGGHLPLARLLDAFPVALLHRTTP